MTAPTRLTRDAIDPASAVPLYYQIREHLRELITAETFNTADPLPSERELSEVYGVNRLTVRQAIAELVNEGLLRRQRGVGTFVSDAKITQAMPDLVGFSERMRRAGRQPSNRVIAQTVEPPTQSAANALGIQTYSECLKLVRLRLVDNEPFMIETSYFPLLRFPGLEKGNFETESLYKLLARQYDLQIVEAQEVIEPVILTTYEAHLLDTEPGRPGLLVEGTIFAAGQQPIEFTKSLVRGDKARFLFRLHRVGDTNHTT